MNTPRQLASERFNSEHSTAFPIDVVIPWVDDTDPIWQAERDTFINQAKLEQNPHSFDAGVDRFRSWDNLQYIFRGIETFMPWVRTIHLITNRQMPKWLNLSSPKLNFVKHSDYIPQEYLPTFNSHVIELNLHRIDGLAEHFIYFNDDTFVIEPMSPVDFFSKDGLPRDQFSLWRVEATRYNSVLPHICINNMAVLNQNFDPLTIFRTTYWKLLDPRNSIIRIMLTVIMTILSRKNFANMLFHHMPAAFLKQSFVDVWQAEPAILSQTSSHKFRSKDDVNQHLVRAWQMIHGKFVPKNISSRGKHFTYITDDFSIITRALVNKRIGIKRLKMFCISDEKIKDFSRAKREINAALEQLLPTRSTLEIANIEPTTIPAITNIPDIELPLNANAAQQTS